MCICSIEAAFYLIEQVYRQAANDLDSSNPRIQQDAADFLKYLLPDLEHQRESRRRRRVMRFNDDGFDATRQEFFVSTSARRIASKRRLSK